MNQIICENEAVLLCTRQQDGVCILRCRTADPILRLPRNGRRAAGRCPGRLPMRRARA